MPPPTTPIVRTPIINDDGSMTVGTVFENAWKTEFYNQIDNALGAVQGAIPPTNAPWPTPPPATPLPAWKDIPFNAAQFVGGTGVTWTVSAGNVAWNRIMKYGQFVIWTFSITGTTLSGAGNHVFLVHAEAITLLQSYSNLVTPGGGGWIVPMAGNNIGLFNANGTNFTPGATFGVNGTWVGMCY